MRPPLPALAFRPLRPVLFALAFATVTVGAAAASNQPKAFAGKNAMKPPAKHDVSAAVQKLRSGDEAQIRSGLDELRTAGPSAAAGAPAVADALGSGLTEPLTIQAIDTLGDLESEAGTSVLVQYASHRVLAVRRAAVRALTHTKGAVAAQALRRALGDADPQVRGIAAAGLGALKAHDAVPDLFAALDHRVHEAAASIGLLCDAQQCLELVGRLGKLPFDVVTSGLEPMLFRPSAELSDDTKLKVLERMRALGTGEANRFLKDVEKHLPKDASPRLRAAVGDAVRGTTGGSQ